jgi:protein-tyrosine-phosphatase
MGGSPATPDAVDAVGAMDESMARDLENHRSSMLTRDLLNEADVVFTLTRAHADAVLSIDPSMSARVFLLDPAGGDVPDPIGQPRTVYDDTARVIRSHVAARLRELVG